MRPQPLPAFEGADAMNGEGGKGREFFLCVACGFAKCFQLRAKRPWRARLHEGVILLLCTHLEARI